MIDAQIPLQTQQPNFLSQIGQVQNLQAQQQNMQIQGQNAQLDQQGKRLSLASAGQDQQDNADVRAAIAAATNPATGQMDRGVLLSTIGKLNPYKAQQMAANLNMQDTASQEAQTKLQKAQLDMAATHVDAKDRLLQGVTDQATYTNALDQGVQLGIIKPGDLPAVYNPALVQQLHQMTLTQKEQLDAHMKQQGIDVTQQNADETARHNAATEALTASQQAMTGKYQQGELGVQQGNLQLNRDKFKLESGTATDPTNGLSLVDSIGTGKVAPDRMATLISRNPGLIQAVVQKYPDFDSSKVGAYAKAYGDYTSSKTNTAGGALNAGATALGHLNELKDMNTVESHIPGTPDYNAYQNKADTVAMELARFYGDSTVSGIESIKKTLTSTLPYTRAAAIQTQAQSMGDKFDAYEQTWKNAAPSKAYEAPMPGISPQAMKARAALDPRYKAPDEAVGMVMMKAPNGQTRPVPADQVEHYKAQGATVVQ